MSNKDRARTSSKLVTMPLDSFLTDYHFRGVHAVTVLASPDRVYGALKALAPRDVPLLRVLFTLRALPAMVTGKADELPDGALPPGLDEDVVGVHLGGTSRLGNPGSSETGGS